MRPSLDFNLEMSDSMGVASARCGTDVASAPTERITLPDGPNGLNLSDEAFFAVGDAGTYDGGPADVAVEPELEDPTTLPPPPPSPEQLKRRRRASRGVALAMGAFAAMSVVALVRIGIATAQSGSEELAVAAPPAPIAAAMVVAPKAQPAQVAGAAKPPPAVVPAPPEAAPEPEVASEEPAPETKRAPPAKQAKRVVFVPKAAPAALPAAPAALPPAPAVAAMPPAAPVAPAPAAPAAAGVPPTASFPVN